MASSTKTKHVSKPTSKRGKPTRRKPHFLGIGELAYDHIYEEGVAGLTYRFSAGGGSVGNVLANLATLGASTAFVGICGNDPIGDAALADLEAFGVDCSGGMQQKGHRTLLVHEILAQPQPTLFAEQRHQFTLKCPVCGHSPGPKRAVLPSKVDIQDTLSKSGSKLVVVDRLNAYAASAMRQGASDEHCLVALDVGRVGFVRYRSLSQIISSLRLADVIFLSAKVFGFLKSQLRTNPEDWTKTFPGQLLLVGAGPEGLGAYDFRSGKMQTRHFAPLSIEPKDLVDDAGAGDVFFAHFLHQLAQQASSRAAFQKLTFPHTTTMIAHALENVRPALRSAGARGHLAATNQTHTTILHRFKDASLPEIKHTLEQEAVCPFCQSSPEAATAPKVTRHSNASVYRSNLNQLVDRVSTLAGRIPLLNNAKRVLPASGTVYAVGTGGSYAAASYFASLVNETSEAFAQVVRPLDYLRSAKRTDHVFVFTYSGRTPDCAMVIREAIKLNVGKIVLVTGPAKPELSSLLRENRDEVLSYERSDKLERGFVAIRGTVYPCGIFAASTSTHAKFLDAMVALQEQAKAEITDTVSQAMTFARAAFDHQASGGVIEVFGGGWAWPAILDLESKFAEGGLGCLRIHEPKDFSHGRFISVLPRSGHRAPAIYLTVGEPSSYDRKLMACLTTKRTILHLASQSLDALGGLELLMKIQYFVRAFGEIQGKDISRPGFIAPRGLALYHWKSALT